MKNRSPGQPDWVVMKTPMGDLRVAFVKERDAQEYLAATEADAFCEAVSRETLLQNDSKARDGIEPMLLLPSMEVVRRLLGRQKLK